MKGIIVASFGTSYEDAYKSSVGNFANEIKEKYKDYYVLESFSSEVIRSKLKKRGIEKLNLSLALEKMREKGIKEVYVLMLYIIDGIEYEKVLRQGQAFEDQMDISYTSPLLVEGEYENIGEIFDNMFDQPTILMGHGTNHQADVHYGSFQEELFKRNCRIYLATIDGDRELDHIIEELKEPPAEKVILTPFLLVAGDHAKNDMADKEDEDSWYNILLNNGFNIDLQVKGLCERPEICQVFKDKLESIL